LKTQKEEYYRIDDLMDKEVYDYEAKKLGFVKEIMFSKKNGRLALLIGSNKEKETLIHFDDIFSVGDVILLKPKVKKHEAQVKTSSQ
ncbi:MAG: PRC-barrel domain-containing protein, partial [Candidatus Bathyarchaeia archaeon]